MITFGINGGLPNGTDDNRRNLVRDIAEDDNE